MASEIGVQSIRDNSPKYIYNKHTTYENTMLNIYYSIITNLRNTDTVDALLEIQVRGFIGGLMKEKTEKFIKERYQKFYDEISPTIQARTTEDQRRITNARVWDRIMTEAFGLWLDDHHADHTRAKIVAIDRYTPEGKEFVEIGDIDFLPPEDFHKPGLLINHKNARPVWSYAQYIAKQITGPKNIDKKIFVVGDAGDGKSLTAYTLAKRIDYWVAYYVNLKRKETDPIAKPGDYFKFDKDHIGCIIADDLINAATSELPEYSIKILDDIGAALGFTNRRSMSGENLDMVSIIGTNRVRNGVMIYTLHTEEWADLRIQALANEKIDLKDYVESYGKYRIGKLSKIKRQKRNKIIDCRFGFWSYGEYCTVEGIICFTPNSKETTAYNEYRKDKEHANTAEVREKYKRVKQEQEIKDERERCKYCGRAAIYHGKTGVRCNACGKYQ